MPKVILRLFNSSFIVQYVYNNYTVIIHVQLFQKGIWGLQQGVFQEDIWDLLLLLQQLISINNKPSDQYLPK